jgi:hypothetical protein
MRKQEPLSVLPFPTESGATLKKALQVNPQITEATQGLEEINVRC